MHKPIGIIILLALGLTTAGCGSSTSGSNSINGSWFATLTNSPDGSTAYTFAANFTEVSGNGLDVTNFSFSVPGPCFASYSADQYSETGSFTLGANSGGKVTGTFGMTITTVFPAPTNNVLTLTGTVNGNTITGNWSATGLSGCSGNGTFTIHPPMAGP